MADASRPPAVPTVSEWYDDVPRSIRTHAGVGLTRMAATFGGFGA